MANRPIKAPDPSRQVRFHQLLVGARKTWLADALSEALLRVNPVELKTQLSMYVPDDVQRILSAAGVRDEYIFPTPIVLEEAPTLIGYYRLLLGAPKAKQFYIGATGMGQFKSMEERGILTTQQRRKLPDFCKAMSEALAELIRQLSPTVTQRDIDELPILTLGQQLQGANNVRIGEQAKEGVFLIIAELVKNYMIKRDTRTITVRNSSNRTVIIAFAADPDVSIEEEFTGARRKKVAIEIKGGTDKSNAYNRSGEAENPMLEQKDEDFGIFGPLLRQGKSMSTACTNRHRRPTLGLT